MMNTKIPRLTLLGIALFLVPLLIFQNKFSQIKMLPPKSSEAQRVDVLLAKFDHSDAPGVVVGVYNAGKVIYSKAQGMADIEHHIQLSDSSVFDIASMSKQFTAMAVVLLQADGRLSLDDDILKFLPEVHTNGKKITIRQLLQHISGIRDYLDLMQLSGKNPDNSVVTQADVLDIISKQRQLNFNPGDAFRYENSSYALMATLVQRVSGKSLRQFAQERIFGPLQMNSTHFRDNHNDVFKNAACGFEPHGSAWNLVTPIYDEVGDGGVWTTVGDLARWDANFYVPKLADRHAINLLLSQAVLNDSTKLAYALGLFVERYRGFTMVSHGGVDPGYRGQMLRFPLEQLTITVLANSPVFDVEGLARAIADVYLPADTAIAQKKPLTSVPETRAWSQLAGRYLDESNGRIREIVHTTDGLVLRSRGRDYPLIHQAGLQFEDPSDGMAILFEVRKAAIMQMKMSLEGQMPSVSYQLPVDIPSWNVADYQGAYSSTELGVKWNVEASGSNLVLRSPGTETLSILDKDQFVGGPGLIHFLRNEAGRVIAFTVTNVRDSGIAFQRQDN